jgi:hypothetical protein
MNALTLLRKTFMLVVFALAVAFLSFVGYSAKRGTAGKDGLVTFGASPAYADAPTVESVSTDGGGGAESGTSDGCEACSSTC